MPIKTEDPVTPVAPPEVSPRRSVDANGRALPMTEAEIRARAVEIARGLNALDEMGDEEEQLATFEALKKAIDEDPLSDRKRFRLTADRFRRPGPAVPFPAPERA